MMSGTQRKILLDSRTILYTILEQQKEMWPAFIYTVRVREYTCHTLSVLPAVLWICHMWEGGQHCWKNHNLEHRLSAWQELYCITL